METAKPHQLLRPCFEQRVGPDGLQIVPRCEASSQDETKPRLLWAASVLERTLEANPKDILRALQGRGMLHCNPRGGGAYSLWSSGKQKQRREDGAGQTSSHCFAFCPGKHSGSRKLLPTREKRKSRVKELWHRAAFQARLIRSRTSALWMIFWQGIRASFC